MNDADAAPVAVDLFCGAGGASCGIDAAGFDLAAAVDTNTDALDTHAANLPGYTVAHDLRDVDLSVLPGRARSPTYVHGSPPCKGFSLANDNRDADDPRNSLVFAFVEWVEALQPAVVTMENVTGMLSITTTFMDRVEAAFRDAGYQVKYRTLNAADFGVPQTRKRVITVAVREDLPAPSRWVPRPTHAETATTTLDGRELESWVTVEQAIGDLAKPASSTGGPIRADGGVVANHVPQEHTEQARQRFRDILAGRREGSGLSGRVADLDDPSPTITADETAAVPPIRPPNHEAMNSDRQRLAEIEPGTAPSAAMARVAADQPSNTLVAGKAAPPAHYETLPNHDPRETTNDDAHEWESDEPATTICNARLNDRGHHEHNWEGARRLTVRECARLQSFPDWFVFEGSKTSQYAQVGNAVPPLLQAHVASHLRGLVDDLDADHGGAADAE